ncbi:DUF4233 domain-containing protein [Streptomyces odonnellii]|uniref:DUF4233 domain-containing protein n=1 Tax=Streptomyces odonnellii TaxID=1417980 RepID=UPI000626B651|nr:DUF4233 domain-containing protein [Streptomyces odonnellii]
MRTLCASTLLAEVFVIGFAGLVAMKSDGLSTGTVWTVCGVAMLLCLLLCGMITRPGGVQLGWALQIALVASGFVVPVMFALGAIFAVLWWASVHYGRVIDQAKARWAEQAGEPGEPAGASAQAPGQASAEADAV